jgi:hypothetical protein
MADFVAPIRRVAIVGDDDYPYSNCVVTIGACPTPPRYRPSAPVSWTTPRPMDSAVSAGRVTTTEPVLVRDINSGARP